MQDEVRAAREGLTRLYRELDRVDESLKKIEQYHRRQKPPSREKEQGSARSRIPEERERRRDDGPIHHMTNETRRQFAEIELTRLNRLKHTIEKANRENSEKMQELAKKINNAKDALEDQMYRHQMNEIGPLTFKYMDDLEEVEEKIAAQKKILGINSQMRTNEFYN